GNQDIDRATVNGGVLLFAGPNSGSIQLGCNVQFAANGKPPVLSALNLNPLDVNNNLSSLSQYIIQGRLIGDVDGSGNLTSLTLTPFNYANGTLNSLDIPAGVTVSNVGFALPGSTN